jgi:hypothetical protein
MQFSVLRHGKRRPSLERPCLVQVTVVVLGLLWVAHPIVPGIPSASTGCEAIVTARHRAAARLRMSLQTVACNAALVESCTLREGAVSIASQKVQHATATNSSFIQHRTNQFQFAQLQLSVFV